MSHKLSKGVRLTCFLEARMTHSGHHWWSSLVSLDSSHQYLFNNISGVIIKNLVCLWGLFISFFSLSLLSHLSLLNLVSNHFVIWKSCIWHLHDSRILDVICEYLNCIISLNIFWTVLFYHFFSYYARV